MTDDDKLIVLNIIAPFGRWQKFKNWLKIQHSLEIGVFGVFAIFKQINVVIKAVGGVFLAIILTLSSLTTNAEIVLLEAHKTGWNATLKGDNLSIEAVNPMIVTKNKVCVLWLKKDGKILKMIHLPDGGERSIILSQSVLKQIKGATLLISIEHKNNITQPQKIEYKRHI